MKTNTHNFSVSFRYMSLTSLTIKCHAFIFNFTLFSQSSLLYISSITRNLHVTDWEKLALNWRNCLSGEFSFKNRFIIDDTAFGNAIETIKFYLAQFSLSYPEKGWHTLRRSIFLVPIPDIWKHRNVLDNKPVAYFPTLCTWPYPFNCKAARSHCKIMLVSS